VTRSRRAAFGDLVARQLALFAADHRELLADCEAARLAYRKAQAGEAEERYGDYLDLVDAGREALEEIRDAFATTLAGDAAAEYRLVFADAARRVFPELALELD